MSIFRRKAKKFHPDKGGEHEEFLKLSQAYGLLMKMLEKAKPGQD